MSIPHRSLRGFVVCLVGLGLVAACSGSDGFSPTAPPSITPAAVTGNSVVSGVVALEEPGGTPRGIRVDVEGTSLSDRTDRRGRFRLVGVAEGTARLRFRRDLLDVAVSVHGIPSGAHVSIEVVLASEGGTVLQSAQEDLIEFEGEVAGVDIEDGALFLTDGRSVLAGEEASTAWDDTGDLTSLEAVAEALARDSRVMVEGTAADEDGVLVATEIKAEEEPDGGDEGDEDDDMDPEPVEFAGRVTGVDVAAEALTVEGAGTVRVDTETVWESGDVETLEDLEVLVAAGNVVDAEGEGIDQDGDTLARTLRLEVREVDFEDAVDSANVAVGLLNLNDGARIEADSETDWSGDALSVQAVADALAGGATAEAAGRGLRQADGTILASSLHVAVDEPEDDSDDDPDDDSDDDDSDDDPDDDSGDDDSDDHSDDDSDDDDSDDDTGDDDSDDEAAVDFSAEIDAVEDLADEAAAAAADADLNGGQTNALLTPLEQAVASLERGNGVAAANQLGAFMNKVRALAQSGQLDAEAADALLEEAGEIRAAIEAKL